MVYVFIPDLTILQDKIPPGLFICFKINQIKTPTIKTTKTLMERIQKYCLYCYVFLSVIYILTYLKNLDIICKTEGSFR